MMFRPEVPMTSRKAVLEKMGELVIESPSLRTSSGPSRYCADPGGRDILATPEEIAAARCGDCKKLTTLAARRAIDAGAKRVDLAMTVTDEPDEHVFMIVDGEFRDPAREAGMPCRIIDLFIPVTIWPLSEFGKSSPTSAGTVDQIRGANASASSTGSAPSALVEETMMHQDEAALYEAYRNASGGNAGGTDEMALALHDAFAIPFTTPHREPFFPEAESDEHRAQGGNAGGTDEMALALHDAFESPFTTPHREPFFPEAEVESEHRSQGPADTLANLGLIDAWSQNAQTQWNVDASRAQGPAREELSPEAAKMAPIAAAPARSMALPPAGAPAMPKSMPSVRETVSAMPAAPAMSPKPMASVREPASAAMPSAPAMIPKSVAQMSPAAMPSSPATPKSMPGHAVLSPAALAMSPHLGEPTHGQEPTPTHGQEPTPTHGQEPTPIPTHGQEPTPTHGQEPTPIPTHGQEPTPTHGQPSGHPTYGQPGDQTRGQPVGGGERGQPSGGGGRWQPRQPPVEGVTRSEGREEWRGGAWVPTQPGHWREGEFRTASDGSRLIYRRGDWVRGDETSQVVVFSDGSFRTYFLDGRWRDGLAGEAYPEGPIFHDVATLPLGSRFSFFVSGISAYRLDNFTGKLFYLGQYMPDHNVLVGSVLYHPRPDGTLIWVGPAAYGVNPQADVNLVTYQSAPAVSAPAFTTGSITGNTDIFATRTPPRPAFGPPDSRAVAHMTGGTRVQFMESASPGEGRDRVWYKVAMLGRPDFWGWVPESIVRWDAQGGREVTREVAVIPRVGEELEVFHDLHRGEERREDRREERFEERREERLY